MEDNMKKRNILFLGLLVMVLAMGMIFAGCDPDDDDYDYDSSGSNNNGENNNPGGNNPGGGTTVPSAPTGVTATAQSASAIQISWSAVSGATSYTIEVRTTSDGSWSSLTTVTGTSHTHSGLSASTQRWYRVFAVNSAGTSNASSIVNATTSAAFTPPTRAQLETFLENYRTNTTLMGGSAAVYIRSIAINTYTIDGSNVTSNPSPVPENAQVTVRFTVRTILSSGNLTMGEMLNIDNFRGDLQSALRTWLRDQGFGQSNITITTGNTIFG
jgi:hypothetical protein